MRVDEVIKGNEAVRLLRQRNILYPLTVIHRAFREEYSSTVPISVFRQVCEALRLEMGAEGAEQFTSESGEVLRDPDDDIRYWTSRSSGQAPWFSLVIDPDYGESVLLLPAAKAAYDLAVMAQEQESASAARPMNAVFSEILDAAAHLRGDVGAQISALEQEVAEKRLLIERLKLDGAEPANSADRKRYAAALTALVLNALRLIQTVPESLRAAHRTARDIYHKAEGTHSDIMTAMVNETHEVIQSPGYKSLETLSALAIEPERREMLEEAIRVILQECGGHLSETTHQRSEDLLFSVSAVSRKTITQYRELIDTLRSFMTSDISAERTEDIKALNRLTDAMRGVAPKARLGKRSLNKLGLMLRHERSAPARLFDLKLSSEIPVREAVEVTPVQTSTEQDPAHQETLLAGYKKSHRLAADTMGAFVANQVNTHGPLPLSYILIQRPPRYGAEELVRYVQAALERVPSEFPGWWFEVVLPHPKGGMMSYVVPDPVFKGNARDAETAIQDADRFRPRAGHIFENGGRLALLKSESSRI